MKFIRKQKEKSPTLEYLLKNFSDIAKKSTEYGPETLIPFIDSFISFMKFDIEKETFYLRRIFEYIKPVILKAMQSGWEEAVDYNLKQLSDLEEFIINNHRQATHFFLSMSIPI